MAIGRPVCTLGGKLFTNSVNYKRTTTIKTHRKQRVVKNIIRVQNGLDGQRIKSQLLLHFLKPDVR